ncbi:hypothetical protein M405DRAFT_931780 [Rhizopogon salebrosus TDB-379]|nr:hypothetical protein M405DRAFT_931780 [Rhizopogon salebrosus TDB-379]
MSKWQSQKEEREAQHRGEEIRESTSEAEDDVLLPRPPSPSLLPFRASGRPSRHIRLPRRFRDEQCPLILPSPSKSLKMRSTKHQLNSSISRLSNNTIAQLLMRLLNAYIPKSAPLL